MTPEGQLQRTIMDWLAAKRILAFRMNTGAVKTEKRFFRFGVPGMADILAFPRIVGVAPVKPDKYNYEALTMPVWIEVKADTRQSVLQKSFQQQVEEHGHRYILAKSLDDVIAVLEG